MFRVLKVDGWNKYKVQKRFMFLFWRDADGGRIHTGKGLAGLRAAVLLSELKRGK